MRTRTLALLTVETAVLLLLLEIGTRLVAPPQVDVPHQRVFAQGFYTWYPGARFTYHNLPDVDPPAVPIRINEHGLRGSSFPTAKPPGERRVLVLGDSYTAAVQLPEEAIFTTLLARRLNEDAPPDVRYRVLNAGFNGASTAHELLYFLARGRALAPDVVVLQLCFNDVEDNVARGGFRVIDGRLDLDESLRRPPRWRGPLLALRDAIGNRSLAFYLLYKAAGDAFAGLASARAQAAAGAAEAEDLEPGVELTRLLAARLVAAANAAGAPVVVLTIPEPIYLAGADRAYDQVIGGLRDAVAGTRNRLIVADPLLLAAERAGRRTYLAADGHLSRDGHELIATALASAILGP
jgi:lysophospholipase L1-like esterase